MDKATQLIHWRNIIVNRFTWGFVAVAIIAGLYTGRPANLLEHPIMLALLMAVVLTFLIKKKIAVIPTMYAYICLIYLYFFLLLVGSPLLANFLFMWLGLVISAIYHNYVVIILSGFFSILITLYAFLVQHDAIFPQVPGRHLVYFILFGIFMTLFLIDLTRFTRNLWLKAERNELHLHTILENVDIATLSLDAGTGQLELSSGLEKITGIKAHVINENPLAWLNCIHPDDINEVENVLSDAAAGETKNAEFRILCADGQIRWLQGRVFKLSGEQGQVLYNACVLIDITDRKEMETQIEYLAYHDPLTGLPNRAYLQRYAETTFQSGKEEMNSLAVLYIDLNGFKTVNDSLGHKRGDQLLQMIAGRLENAVEGRGLLVRLGGDEFVIVAQDFSREECLSMAGQLIQQFKIPFSLADHPVIINLSMGVSYYPDHGADMETLLDKADKAMYQVKPFGSSRIKVYED